MEGSFVKKLLLFLMFLLMATAGCDHKPVKAIVLIPTADNEMPSVKAQAAASLNSGWTKELQQTRALWFSFRGRSAIQATSWKEAIRNQ